MEHAPKGKGIKIIEDIRSTISLQQKFLGESDELNWSGETRMFEYYMKNNGEGTHVLCLHTQTSAHTYT